jgi:hypothetical protein
LEVLAMAARDPRFFEKTYERKRFAGMVGELGPYIFDVEGNDGAELGASSIVYDRPNRFEVEDGTPNILGWWIADHGNRFSIYLDGLTDAARKELASDFGLKTTADDDSREWELFEASAAFEALCRCAMEHPTLYRRCERYQDYLPWVEMVEAWKSKTKLVLQ